MNMSEGYIKFNCDWEQKEFPVEDGLFGQLESSRSKLYDLGLIGLYPNGIGFGNISVRLNNSAEFVITGSATGQFAKLNRSHYALVKGYNFKKNTVSCTGLTKASAESLSHAAIYEAIPEAGAVVHIHSLQLWQKLLNVLPTTSGEIDYGTPEMAEAIQRLVSGMKNDEKIIVMGGHSEGILAFGRTLDETTTQIINLYKQHKHD
jgi:L-ribulose-5-phosphate 4-epimerase